MSRTPTKLYKSHKNLTKYYHLVSIGRENSVFEDFAIGMHALAISFLVLFITWLLFQKFGKSKSSSKSLPYVTYPNFKDLNYAKIR